MPEARLARAAEALIFAADEPVSAREVARVLEEVTGGEGASVAEIEAAVESLNRAYEEAGLVLRIEAWAGGYRMATVPEVAPYIRALLAREQERRLSRSLMEALAVIAYRQPVTKPEIDFVRGVDSDYALRRLLERDLVAVVGRSDGLGRPLLYGTTDVFLEQIGLASLEELPRPREIEELLNDPAFARERAELLGAMNPEPAPPDAPPQPEEPQE